MILWQSMGNKSIRKYGTEWHIQLDLNSGKIYDIPLERPKGIIVGRRGATTMISL